MSQSMHHGDTSDSSGLVSSSDAAGTPDRRMARELLSGERIDHRRLAEAAGGIVHLKDFSVPRLAVVADALAKSAALSHQENLLAQTLDVIEPVVPSLRGQGRMSVSSRALLRLVGSALSGRNRAAAPGSSPMTNPASRGIIPSWKAFTCGRPKSSNSRIASSRSSAKQCKPCLP